MSGTGHSHDFAQVAAEGFARKQAAAGTLAGACWGSPHAQSLRAARDAGVRYSLIGPAVMTTGEPAALRRSLEESMAELRQL